MKQILRPFLVQCLLLAGGVTTVNAQLVDSRVTSFEYVASTNTLDFVVQMKAGAAYVQGSGLAGDWSALELTYDLFLQPGVSINSTPNTYVKQDLAPADNISSVTTAPQNSGIQSVGSTPGAKFKVILERTSLGAAADFPNTFTDYFRVKIPVITGTPTGATKLFQRPCNTDVCGGSFWGNSATPFLDQRPITTNVAAGAPLATDLLSFTAAATPERTAKLDWATASEKASSHFLVERSSDGLRFADQVARMQAAGTSTDELNYHTFDTNPLTGANYYRLKMVNMDGTYKYSETRRLVFDAPMADVTAIPNPFQSATAIRVNADRAQMANYYLMDATGRVIRTGVWEVVKGMQEFPMPLADAASGNYILTVQGSTILAELRLVKTN